MATMVFTVFYGNAQSCNVTGIQQTSFYIYHLNTKKLNLTKTSYLPYYVTVITVWTVGTVVTVVTKKTFITQKMLHQKLFSLKNLFTQKIPQPLHTQKSHNLFTQKITQFINKKFTQPLCKTNHATSRKINHAN